ncbi:MAG: hypothetical protein RMK18_07620 [Armatimonadota bacterium]|nr:hypothetical protein [Armatimonadota bacterium]MCX7776674.1 hypothetical protein [Armatimonadota bacterium]MDW8025711.1 hypothetical protein [Armatimonadota bacterium]
MWGKHERKTYAKLRWSDSYRLHSYSVTAEAVSDGMGGEGYEAF